MHSFKLMRTILCQNLLREQQQIKRIAQMKQLPMNLGKIDIIQKDGSSCFSSCDKKGKKKKLGRKFIVIANVIYDSTAILKDTKILDKFKLKLGARDLLELKVLKKVMTTACKENKCHSNPGGSAMNTLRLLNHLGVKSTFFGAIGKDKKGDAIRKVLKKKGIDARLEVVKEHPTGRCMCFVYKEEVALFAYIGASERFTLCYLKEQEKKKPFLRPPHMKQLFYLEGFFVPLRTDTCKHVLKNYIKGKHKLALNLNAPFIVELFYKDMMPLIKKSTFVFGNDEEFGALMKKMCVKNPMEMACKILKPKRKQYLILTRGAKPVTVYTNVTDFGCVGDVRAIETPIPKVSKIVDTTGCGDAFVAGYLNGWMCGNSIQKCVCQAIELSQKVATVVGCNLPGEKI